MKESVTRDECCVAKLAIIKINIWVELAPENSTILGAEVGPDSLPKEEVSASILIVTDAVQDASRVHMLDLSMNFDGDTDLEFGKLSIVELCFDRHTALVMHTNFGMCDI
jgi:hypothetical protein